VVTVFVVTSAVKIDLTTCFKGVLLCPFPIFWKKAARCHKNQAVIYIKKERWGMQRKKSFVVVFALLVFALGSRAQTGVVWGPVQDLPGVPQAMPLVPLAAQGISANAQTGLAEVEWKRLDLNKLIGGNPPPQPYYTPGSTGSLPGASVSSLADDYYSCHFGFFCKKELEFEKTTHIPLRFRLGSLEQCNALEGKK
jgi:hypothetical protein